MTARTLSTTKQISRLWSHMLPRRKRQLILCVGLMLIAATSEILSIGALLPFLGVLTAPERIFNNERAQPLIYALHIESAQAILLPFTVLFILTILLAGVARVALLWFQTRLSMAISADLSVLVYERSLYQTYSVHLERNSSVVLSGVSKASSLVTFMIQPLMTILSSITILLAVIFALIAIEPTVALTALLGLSIIYFVVVAFTRSRITRNSEIIASQQIKVTKVIQESLGGIRDIIISGAQPLYSRFYQEAFIPVQRALANNQLVAQGPKFGVESLGIVLISGLAYALVAGSFDTGTDNDIIPVLGALALGAQRLLPVCQQLYNAGITIKGHQASTEDSLDLLDQPMRKYDLSKASNPMPFQKAITLKDLGFRYSDQGPWVLKNVNLTISKGSRVGFIGATGSGKSTLLDIVMGLLSPTRGEVLVDGIVVNERNSHAWQANISHVPQAIYLSDSTIRENIAFGVPTDSIDLDRVKQVAQQAQISQSIDTWPNRYDTIVGERGLRLSGGQRQRIGIARALYKGANVIAFDEATSALDSETEAEVVEAIENLSQGITMLVVAHRVSTLRNCDLIIELADGRIKTVSSYEQILARTASRV